MWRTSRRRRTAEEPTLPAHRPSRLPGQAVATPASPGRHPTGLARFNAMPADEAERTLLACCGSCHWARRIAAHRPYPDLDALLAASDEAAYDLTPADVAEALACESLTLLPDGAYSAAHMALSAAHAAYESRFGHVFVICLDDTPPEESPDLVLTEISSRLANDPDKELTLAAEELRHLTRGRLTRSLEATPKGAGNGAVLGL
ncbi:2-oxo-4-hydroxy-4-carboxy-5-ureidoimidazoline decarboxylase [Streptomyces sp. NPDC087844]|uniref:2-oxo-4-hydroxy-4-carboxy-5-ureidoimidazoline decarboxylase n=1 Tax=Streptomyces sp. NPDC087844 TaxID=3365805 RepID=UPI00382E9705